MTEITEHEDGWDIDKLVSAIADTCTITTNEIEKREAIKTIILNSGWYQYKYDHAGSYAWGA